MIENNSRRANRSTIWLLATAAAMFVVLAVAGGFITSRHMNSTADMHAMSAGRTGDAKPNGIQEQQNDKSARGTETIGSALSNTAVPPAR